MNMRNGYQQDSYEIGESIDTNDEITIDANGSMIAEEQTIYDELKRRKYLTTPAFPKPLGLHLVNEGELGLLLANGKPRFLAPGRYTFENPLNKFKGVVSISDRIIRLGSIEIVTIRQGEIGLSTKNGKNIILEEGRYILEAPHKFIQTAKTNERYIQLGTHIRLTVPAGFVAIAYDNGRPLIITEADCKSGPYINNSPTFSFDPATGFQPIQLQVVELEKLTVNTQEMIPIKVEGIITYRITEPTVAFFTVKDVHEALKRQAEATLTNVFAHLSIDEIASSLSTDRARTEKGKAHVLGKEDDFIHKATTLFLEAFKEVVAGWGVELTNLNIEKMEFIDKEFADTLRTRAQKRMETDTSRANVDALTDIAIKEADRDRQRSILQAEGNANAAKIEADAQLYVAQKKLDSAQLLNNNPLSAELAILDARAKIVGSMGDKTVFMPHEFEVTSGLGNNRNNFWAGQRRNMKQQKLLQSKNEDALEVSPTLRMNDIS